MKPMRKIVTHKWLRELESGACAAGLKFFVRHWGKLGRPSVEEVIQLCDDQSAFGYGFFVMEELLEEDKRFEENVYMLEPVLSGSSSEDTLYFRFYSYDRGCVTIDEGWAQIMPELDCGEGGIESGAEWMTLDSKASIPRTAFPGAPWPEDLYVVPEYCFAVNTGGTEIRLSSEHDKFEWLGYEAAHERLTWDSNRVALWELQERLRGQR